MDTKNVIAAISLSAAVIVLYALFFPPTPTQKTQNVSEKNIIEKNSDTPALEEKKKVISESVKLDQEYRSFDFESPWEGTKYIKEESEKKTDK